MTKIQEQTYSEVDFETLTIKRKDGKEVPESEFNMFAALIEEKMSKGDYIVIIEKLSPDKYEVKR